MKVKVLLLFGEKDYYMKLLQTSLKKDRLKLFTVYSSNKKKCKNIFKVENNYYDFIFCYRSKYILQKNDIKKSKNPPINFHPGPPEYKGFGCINYALYENAKGYGVTAHIIDEKIDNGKILDIKRFKIKINDNVESLLKKTHKYLYFHAKKIIFKVLNNKKNIDKLINKNQNIKWTNIIKSKQDLDKFYEIDLKLTKIQLDKKIRATKVKNFKPYIIFHDKRFILN